VLAARSGCQGWQAEGGSIAERGDGFQGHIAGALDSPFVILLQQQRPDQPRDIPSHDVAEQVPARAMLEPG